MDMTYAFSQPLLGSDKTWKLTGLIPPNFVKIMENFEKY